MKNVRNIYIAFALAVGLAACGQSDMPSDSKQFDEESVISFSSELPEIAESRGTPLTSGSFTEFYVTSFFGGHDFAASADGNVTYFNDTRFKKVGSENKFRSDVLYVWPVTTLEFFAYYPSLEVMRGTKDIVTDGRFAFVNSLSSSAPGYKLSAFRVPRDISKHFDFMSAHAKKTYSLKKDSIVTLSFNHNLSQIEVEGSFKDGTPKYNLELAGIRIVNPEVEGVFNFCGSSHSSGSIQPLGAWEQTVHDSETAVEYIYGAGEKPLAVGSGNPVSIMGKGGSAMVIPTSRNGWDAKNDGINENFGGYFALLVRATSSAGTRLFPALGISDAEQVRMVYLALDKNGNIITRVYRNASGAYFTDEALSAAYTLPAGAVVKEFGWAAVPVGMNWAAGTKYVYKLNFSSGIGIRDPHDPKPADPILGGNVHYTVEFTPWSDPVNKDIDMPSKKDQVK